MGQLTALIAGVVVGSLRLHKMTALANVPHASGWTIGLNYMVGLSSVRAPIWFRLARSQADLRADALG